MNNHIVTVEEVKRGNFLCRLNYGETKDQAIERMVGDGITILDFLKLFGKRKANRWNAIRYCIGRMTREQENKWLERIVFRAVAKHALKSCIDDWAKLWIYKEDRTLQSALNAEHKAYEFGNKFCYIRDHRACWAAQAARKYLLNNYSAHESAIEACRAEYCRTTKQEKAQFAEELLQIEDLIAVLEEEKCLK